MLCSLQSNAKYSKVLVSWAEMAEGWLQVWNVYKVVFDSSALLLHSELNLLNFARKFVYQINGNVF